MKAFIAHTIETTVKRFPATLLITLIQTVWFIWRSAKEPLPDTQFYFFWLVFGGSLWIATALMISIITCASELVITLMGASDGTHETHQAFNRFMIPLLICLLLGLTLTYVVANDIPRIKDQLASIQAMKIQTTSMLTIWGIASYWLAHFLTVLFAHVTRRKHHHLTKGNHNL